MRIKVCGITQLDQLKSLQVIGIDFAGLIFYNHSKRFAERHISKIADEVKQTSIPKVGVFVNNDEPYILDCVFKYGLSMVQLHGEEPPSFCEKIRTSVPVMKAISTADMPNEKKMNAYNDSCDYILFDTKTEGFGGSGLKFNWDEINTINVQLPFFLSGGISIDDVEAVKAFSHAHYFGIDINSRFEISPGIKDLDLVKKFVQGLKEEN